MDTVQAGSVIAMVNSAANPDVFSGFRASIQKSYPDRCVLGSIHMEPRKYPYEYRGMVGEDGDPGNFSITFLRQFGQTKYQVTFDKASLVEGTVTVDASKSTTASIVVSPRSLICDAFYKRSPIASDFYLNIPMNFKGAMVALNAAVHNGGNLCAALMTSFSIPKMELAFNLGSLYIGKKQHIGVILSKTRLWELTLSSRTNVMHNNALEAKLTLKPQSLESTFSVGLSRRLKHSNLHVAVNNNLRLKTCLEVRVDKNTKLQLSSIANLLDADYAFGLALDIEQ